MHKELIIGFSAANNNIQNVAILARFILAYTESVQNEKKHNLLGVTNNSIEYYI